GRSALPGHEAHCAERDDRADERRTVRVAEAVDREVLPQDRHERPRAELPADVLPPAREGELEGDREPGTRAVVVARVPLAARRLEADVGAGAEIRSKDVAPPRRVTHADRAARERLAHRAWPERERLRRRPEDAEPRAPGSDFEAELARERRRDGPQRHDEGG